MRDYISIGSSPYGEDCAQVGSDYYSIKSRKECAALIGQLRRLFGEEKGTACLAVKSFPHDFGTYHEVICYFNDDDEIGKEYAFKIENELPEHWDEIAKKEIKRKD